MEIKNGAVKFNVFNLRVAQEEKELSFHDASMVTCDQVLAGLGMDPSGWGVAVVSVGSLRDVGFVVRREADHEDPICGHAHVVAIPPTYDAAGQIPQDLRAAIAGAASWEMKPDRTKVN